MSGCTLSHNVAHEGDGIYNAHSGTLTVTGSTLDTNGFYFSSAPGSLLGRGGGIYNLGTLTVSGSTLYGNDAGLRGGGIENASGGTATLINSTLCNNFARGGGALIVDANSTATLTNSTLSNNSAVNGGPLFVDANSSATLINCTLSRNSAPYGDGGGIYVNSNNGGAILNLTNTIVAGNAASTSGPDIYGAVVTADHNLVGDATGSTGIVNGVNGNIVGGNGNPVINALLGPLQNNGAPTQTMALLAGSPAIGTADNALAPATDQRGVTRLNEAGETTDIGAFEL
jgi:hypothetical protein